jgi:hypothetical protein
MWANVNLIKYLNLLFKMLESNSLENHPIMKKYIIYYKKLKDYKLYNFFLLYTGFISALTGPFYTIAISRQLSVNAHKEIYGDYVSPSDSKELMNVKNEVTLREARNYELIKSAGTIEGQKPYRAPIYDNYFQTIKGLYNQGILGFYKGNGWRLIGYVGTYRFRILIEWFLRERYNIFEINYLIRSFVVFSVADIFLHPAFLVESRYILQNRIPQFQIYPNFNKFRIRSRQDLYNNCLGHIPKNFFYVLGIYISSYFPSILMQNSYNSMLFSTALCYPILTAMRRLTCQSMTIPGLLPMRYLNLLHALVVIRGEEGLFKGLYKGFFAYIIGMTIWIQIVPGLAHGSFKGLEAKENEEMFEADPVFEEIKRRKIEELLKY